MATTFDGLSKWMKFALIFLGFAFVFMLFSCCMPGWNVSYGVSARGFDNLPPTEVSIQALGVCSFLCIFGAIMICLGCMQSDLNKIAKAFVCALALLGGILLVACVGLYQTATNAFSPVSSIVAIFGGFCSFIAGIFVILDFVKSE